jgi:hypothetical protein
LAEVGRGQFRSAAKRSLQVGQAQFRLAAKGSLQVGVQVGRGQFR